MTIDFRVAIDWQDNGFVNWEQTADDERLDILPNLITNATFGQWTITNGTITNTVNDYGADYVVTTALPSQTEIGDAGSVTGEIVVSPNTTYTAVLWLQKRSTSDNARNLYIQVVETTTSPGSIASTQGTIRTDSGTGAIQHNVTFTTSGTTTRIFLQVDSTSSGWVDQVNCYGLMVVEGVQTPGSFNDGSPLLNTLTTARFSTWTLNNCSAIANETIHGLDYARTTAQFTTTDQSIANAGTLANPLGEIVVSPSTVYTLSLLVGVRDASDYGKNVFLQLRETAAIAGPALAVKNSATITHPSGTAIRHTITFKTTATTERFFFLVRSTSGSWVGDVNLLGLMVVPSIHFTETFNDGQIKVLTHRVIEARWNVGYKTSIINGSVANENRLECSLYNLDNYIDEDKYGDVHRVYIEGSDDGGTTWTRLYTGWTRTWHPIFDTNNPDQHLRFTGVSSRFYMDGIKARLPVQSSQSPHSIMLAIVGAVELPNGETITADTPRAGNTSYTISYAGQNWTEEVDLLRALADTAWGDGRWTFFDRSDEYHGYGVSALNNTGATSDFTITNWLRGTADYRYADPWLNMIEMRVSPRKLGATSTARLWELPASVTVANGASETILARFNDEDKPYQISARSVNIASQTWSAGTPTVTLNAKSTSAYIEITNSTGSSTTLTAMRLNGQKIKTWDSFFEQLQYDTEITNNGNNTLTIPSELPDSVSQAQSFMSDWLELYGEKHHRLWSLVVPGNRGEDSDLIDYTIGNVCSVAYPDGSTYKHYVIGEEWAWRANGQYEKKLYVERIYSNGITPIKPGS